ncbi:hypothetical protein SKAU_G00043760 [Synaphobranchus kaupii]|uniref:Uncharacterized protein n=1 Tax=Synaphobranchus kaupii TaxID=118154 RepID=A0A9Q1G220_SYNKA|nr:hypothetical protein SKAU_G00043760 [Synaphobranchus kaupii]
MRAVRGDVQLRVDAFRERRHLVPPAEARQLTTKRFQRASADTANTAQALPDVTWAQTPRGEGQGSGSARGGYEWHLSHVKQSSASHHYRAEGELFNVIDCLRQLAPWRGFAPPVPLRKPGPGGGEEPLPSL